MAVKNLAVSTLARIKNQSKQEGISNQLGQQLFFQEEFLRRLSKSKYRNNMILKGGMFVYTLTEFDSRPTRDMDFMIRHLSNELDNIENVMAEICRVETGNDYIELEVLGTERITVTHKYPGVKTKLQGKIGNVRVPFSIDVGIDDVIWPEPVIRKIKTRLKDFEEPEICTYSVESTIAEKFDAILLRMETTGRMKDFYDIYYLSDIFDYDGKTLSEAIKKTTDHRQTGLLKDTMERIHAFSSNPSMLTMWNGFEPAVTSGLSFETAIERLQQFIGPIYTALLEDEVFEGEWDCKEKGWK